MKFIAILSCAAVVGLFFLASCSTVKWATPAKAGYEVEEESWASKYISGAKTLSEIVPPPTEARILWDERYKSRHEPWGPSSEMTP